MATTFNFLIVPSATSSNVSYLSVSGRILSKLSSLNWVVLFALSNAPLGLSTLGISISMATGS